MKEYRFENATVRIHEGKYTAEERRAVLEQAARDFYKAILRNTQINQNSKTANTGSEAVMAEAERKNLKEDARPLPVEN